MKYSPGTLILYIVIILINAVVCVIDIILLEPWAVINATCVIIYIFLIRSQLRKRNELNYCRQLTQIATERSNWPAQVAQLERDIFGESYPHDRSYLEK